LRAQQRDAARRFLQAFGGQRVAACGALVGRRSASTHRANTPAVDPPRANGAANVASRSTLLLVLGDSASLRDRCGFAEAAVSGRAASQAETAAMIDEEQRPSGHGCSLIDCGGG
jgi:hypothetical protein